MEWISKNLEVVETVLEDGAVLLNLETKFYYSLNNTGYRIWQLIEEVKSSDELVQKILHEYDSSEEETAKGVSLFIINLQEQQLVTSQNVENQTSNSAETSVKDEKSEKKSFINPELIKHDEPLHEVVQNPFDPQLPLAE